MTEQLVGEEPPLSVQDPLLLKLPLPLLLKETVPVGAVGVPKVSVTCAVHVLALPYVTGFGEHVTAVVVPWFTVTVGLPPVSAVSVPPLTADFVVNV